MCNYGSSIKYYGLPLDSWCCNLKVPMTYLATEQNPDLQMNKIVSMCHIVFVKWSHKARMHCAVIVFYNLFLVNGWTREATQVCPFLWFLSPWTIYAADFYDLNSV